MQLDLPMMVGRSIPVLYIPFDGTGVPVVKKETVGRQGNREGQPAPTREAKLGRRVHPDDLRAGRIRYP